MRVLVIEDDTTLGNALQEFLVQQGYAVDWLPDGETALSAITAQSCPHPPGPRRC
jgi:two-component system OmpR family response regulator